MLECVSKFPKAPKKHRSEFRNRLWTEWKSGWYVVNGDVTINNQIHVDGSVRLILADGCKPTAKNGITVFRNNTLTIYGQSKGTGQLESTGAGTGQKYLEGCP